ncbi:MAG: hypothetical protein F6J86_13765 [Symploca sp. SIO1B1]|nr:hypothetical protein [Symploca sp. SIO1B1]
MSRDKASLLDIVNAAKRVLQFAEGLNKSVTRQQTSRYHDSAIDLLDELPGKRLFKTPEEADQYLQKERSS